MSAEPDQIPRESNGSEFSEKKCKPDTSREHPRDPLHGIKLETIVTELVNQHGWAEMGRRIPIRCFLFNPSVKSSLTFLRKTPWARAKVENWFLMDRAQRLPEP